MTSQTFNDVSNAELEALIEESGFLRLTNSRELYPHANGSGLPLLVVETELCSAVIALQGAQLLAFNSAGGKPLLWLSPNCDFTPGTALRGGIPLCLPWFGIHRDDPSKPKHGFARNKEWQLTHAERHSDGVAALTFVLEHNANELFGFDFLAEIRLFLGRSLKLELTVKNLGSEAFTCSWVMHNYFPVSNLAEVSIPALANRDYKDNFEHHAVKYQSGPLTFPGPVDRVFLAVEVPVVIESNPAISITHHNCPSVVTWNPGAEAAASISDIGGGQEQFFICVERGSVLDEAWHLPAGASQSAWMQISQVEV